MPQQGYSLNVAKATGGVRQYDQTTHSIYTFYVSMFLGDILPEDAKEKARDLARHFPAPMYKLSLNHWAWRGEGDIDFTTPARQPRAFEVGEVEE